jgi:hypothetical protein
MARVHCIPLESRKEWREALVGIPHGFAHTWENCYAMWLTTRHRTFLYCLESGAARVVCPLSERSYCGHVDIYTPSGYSGFLGAGACPDFPSRWADFAHAEGYVCGYIAVNPLFDNPTYDFGGDIQPYNHVYVLDLALSEAELFENLSDNRKRQLRDWDHATKQLIFEREVLKDFFFCNRDEFFRRKNVMQASRFYSKETLQNLFELDNVMMVGAGNGGRVQAVYIVVYTDFCADLLFNISLPPGQSHTAMLTWWTALRLKQLGIPTLNLGGGAGDNDGMAEFKRRFGGRKLPLRAIKQIYRPQTFRELCEHAGVNPDDRTGFFPPYRSHTVQGNCN